MSKNCIDIKPIGVKCSNCGNIYTTRPSPYGDKGQWRVPGCPQCGHGEEYFMPNNDDNRSPCLSDTKK
ncbi:hypothetical protein DMR_09330 [Solidesulfovibrio magneticus RS-1]|uniref:Uncharacterized protein n=1 Tax=Solidesulfovibrio magneticus (strain ATCC 700980 / DSM 13731 / RS-1) TaxID=573370 RepID=C4XKN4_SOLM1|nr:hypothetical protein DMR_09330 [Solidesulfovibrio magneticus RS-1]